MLNIVLVEPEIPQNTGNIARTCAATNTRLHIIRPMGFIIADKYLKRAGLDYWHLLDVTYYDGLDDFFAKKGGGTCHYLTTKAKHIYTDVQYQDEDYLVFGKETKGLPEELLVQNQETAVRIPMVSDARSLNLSNSVAIVLYEAIRQNSFAGLREEGNLTRFNWS